MYILFLNNSVEQGSQTQFHLWATFEEKELAGRFKKKNVSTGHNSRLKVPLY